MGLFGKITWASFVIFVSFILAIVLLVVIGLYLPEQLRQILDAADWVEGQITTAGLPSEYNNWLRLFLDDAGLAMIFFVVVIRGFLAMIGAGFRRMVFGRDTLDA
ncbi:MAG: hypothetical protein JKX99_00195 [Robiginitomaculum sp.]|nr:hypothetical protein [Robiginitomaculum sp.]